MSTARETASLGCEWQRVELLGHCLAESRNGREVSSEVLDRLRELQSEVDRCRQQTASWRRLGSEGLSALECDVVACAVAPEAEPRLGWTFQHLQPGAVQPYPTPALIHELLALATVEANQLHAALATEAPLRQRGLIRMEGEDPYQPIRPGTGVSARLLDRPENGTAPPGAVRVRLRPPFEDLVLPADRITMLRELLLWIRHRATVVEEWGGTDCGGPVALFSGPSGTGKTFAAAVLAAELDWPLYRVDLGTLVSKYIGETEKNLNRLFDAAHGRPVVLQFDEADSLFSKRGEVKEARDRYANMEVSHLLARIEGHRGPCILTTNLRSNLDQAFARRFQVVVDFPRPDVAARTRLWRRLLPPRAPLEPEVDPAFLARPVNLTGGEIRNAALHAAYLAAGAGKAIGLGEIALAVWREMGKDGRDLAPSDLGPLATFLPPGGPPC